MVFEFFKHQIKKSFVKFPYNTKYLFLLANVKAKDSLA